MKQTELKVIAELMKNSHRSDREIAKASGISQPTATRIRTKLEKEGYIKEYTAIPDFERLGYEIMAFTFAKLAKGLTSEQMEKARKSAKEMLEEDRFGIMMLERGLGLGYDGVIVALYKDYTSYIGHIRELSQYPFLEISRIESFLINLKDAVQYRPLTFQTLAKQLLEQKQS